MQYYTKSELNKDRPNWWTPNNECLRALLGTSGFGPEVVGQWGQQAAFKGPRVDLAPNHLHQQGRQSRNEVRAGA
jgi:hypothetical protein